MHVTEREAAAIYARACKAWYGRRAQKVVEDEIKRLKAANDESGVRMWSLVAEQLPPAKAEPAIGRPRSLLFK